MKKIWYTDVCLRSPVRARYHMSPTKGLCSDLSQGKPLACQVCSNSKNTPFPQGTLYAMEKGDKSKVYLCGRHYVEIAKMVQKRDQLKEKYNAAKEGK